MFNRRNARHASGAVKRSPYLVPLLVMLAVLTGTGSALAASMAPSSASQGPRACSHPLLPSGDAKRNAGGAVYICVDGTYVNAVNFTSEP